jgi:hypothetical protein
MEPMRLKWSMRGNWFEGTFSYENEVEGVQRIELRTR